MATPVTPVANSRRFRTSTTPPKQRSKSVDSSKVLSFPGQETGQFAFLRDEYYAEYLALDVFILMMNAFLFSSLLPWVAGFTPLASMPLNRRELSAFCVLALFIIAAMLHAIDIYGLGFYRGMRAQVQRIMVSAGATAGVLFCFAILARASFREVSIAAATCAADVCWLSGWRYALHFERKRATAKRLPLARRAAVLGQYAADVSRKLKERPYLGYVVSAVISDSELNCAPFLLKEQLDKILFREFIDDLFLCGLDAAVLASLRDYAGRRIVKVHLVPDLQLMLNTKIPLRWIAGIPVLTLNGHDRDHLKLIIKRMNDIVGAGFLLLLLAPLMLLIAVAVKLTSRGPVLYCDKRVGEKGTTFQFFKFRTMEVGADLKWHSLRSLNERNGPFLKIKNDPRLTRIGGFLRKYSLDELPQLLNVLRGDMSLVGPRPPLPAETSLYKLEQLGRLHIKPGLTGLWQVSARRDPSFERNVELDLLYIETWSPLSDLKILAMTLPVVFAGTGE